MNLTCKLPLLKPSLPITLAGQGRHCIHMLDFKFSPYTALFVLFPHSAFGGCSSYAYLL